MYLVHMYTASVDPCTIELNAQNPVGTPTYEGDDVAAMHIYSCAANTTCNYDVHVLSCYTDHFQTGNSTVHVDISFVGQSSRPVVLVLLSYEAIHWTLNIQNNVVIDTVIVVSRTPWTIVRRFSRNHVYDPFTPCWKLGTLKLKFASSCISALMRYAFAWCPFLPRSVSSQKPWTQGLFKFLSAPVTPH